MTLSLIYNIVKQTIYGICAAFFCASTAHAQMPLLATSTENRQLSPLFATLTGKGYGATLC